MLYLARSGAKGLFAARGRSDQGGVLLGALDGMRLAAEEALRAATKAEAKQMSTILKHTQGSEQRNERERERESYLAATGLGCVLRAGEAHEVRALAGTAHAHRLGV